MLPLVLGYAIKREDTTDLGDGVTMDNGVLFLSSDEPEVTQTAEPEEDTSTDDMIAVETQASSSRNYTAEIEATVQYCDKKGDCGAQDACCIQ